MKSNPPEEYRELAGQFGTNSSYGMNGCFKVPLHRILDLGHKVFANCIVSDGTNEDGTPFIDWEHVSVHVVDFGKMRIPTWAEMCAIKNIFWDEDECVVQYHPRKSDYVNIHPHVLHLWKLKSAPFPRPPQICV